MIIPFSVTWTASICFNPYSIGFYSLICTKDWSWRIQNFVSILILLDSILLFVLKIEVEGYKTLFQSLFYWILFSYWSRRKHSTKYNRVSILILLDSLLLFKRYMMKAGYLLPVSILILLDSLLLSVLQSRLFIFNSYRVFLRI